MEKIIKESIEDHIDYEEWTKDTEYPSYVFGIRASHHSVNIGDDLPASYDLSSDNWDAFGADELEEYKLRGTCSMEINVKNYIDNPEKTIKNAIKEVSKYGKNLILIYGDNEGQLDHSDECEVIVGNAEVIWSK